MGASMIEFALVIPILILLLMCTFEMGRLLYNYLIMSNIAAEGVRYGAQLSTLQAGCHADFKDLDDEAVPPIDQSLGHWLTQGRIRSLITAYGSALSISREDSGETPVAGSNISTQFIGEFTLPAPSSIAACATSIQQVNTLAVQLRFKYQPLLFSFFALPVNVEVTGPYLINNERFPIATGTGSFGNSQPWNNSGG
jgi:hypothetical protein